MIIQPRCCCAPSFFPGEHFSTSASASLKTSAVHIGRVSVTAAGGAEVRIAIGAGRGRSARKIVLLLGARKSVICVRAYVPTFLSIFALVSTNEALISFAKPAPSSEGTFLKLLTCGEKRWYQTSERDSVNARRGMVLAARWLEWQACAYLAGRSTFEPTTTQGMFCSGRKSLILS